MPGGPATLGLHQQAELTITCNGCAAVQQEKAPKEELFYHTDLQNSTKEKLRAAAT